MSRKKVVILYSGGLDSFLMYRASLANGDDVTCVYYNHGQPVAFEEIRLLPDFVEVLNVDWLDEQTQPVEQPNRREGAIMIPGRNLVMAVLAACKYLPDEIWLGALASECHDKGTDKNRKFLDTVNDTLNYVIGPFLENKIVVRFPLADMGLNKKTLIDTALKENWATRIELIETRSCHNPNYHACGNCVQCVKRWAVFGIHGFQDYFAEWPPRSEFGEPFIYDILRAALGEDTYHDAEGVSEIMPQILNTPRENFSERCQELIKRVEEQMHP